MKQSKYKNIKVTRKLLNGDLVTFDSKKEAKRFDELLLLAKQGIIKNLTLQPEFEIIPTVRWNKKTLCKIKYIADFKYEQNENIVVEDVKASSTFQTDVYKLKKRLFLLQYGEYIIFKEVY